MQVKLVSITQSLIEGINSAEELIIYKARVSNPSNQLNTETAPRLIRYLINNKHWSPFEMVDMTVAIQTSRAVSAQIMRHRSFSFQEFSQRYADVTEFEPIQLRKQADNNRQSSTKEYDPRLKTHDGWVDTLPASVMVQNYIKQGEELYKDLIKAGVAREVARLLLPIAAQTTIYMKGSVRSWIHYLDVRLNEHTQLEHRLVAQAIFEIFQEHFPNISEALHAQGTKG